jgi:hypothetical protein
MDARRKSPVETAPAQGWARRVLRQQLDALSRLAAVAWRLVAPKTPPEQSAPATPVATLRGLEKALRLQARVMWAFRLIDALRARLIAELEALDSGQPPSPAMERSFAAGPGRPPAEEAGHIPEKAERAERAERLRPERFGFEGRGRDHDLAEILKRPTAEIIALICRELGLPDDWPRLAEEEWTREEAGGGGSEQPCPPYPRSSPPS